MIKETGRIIAIDKDSLWVETINRSTCGSCAAEKGCGQSLLAKWGAKNAYIRVLLGDRETTSVQVNDAITIGIPEDVIVKSSLLLYILPVVLLVAGAAIGQSLYQSDLAAIAGSAVGLAAGAGIVAFRSAVIRRDPRLQPVIIDIIPSVSRL